MIYRGPENKFTFSILDYCLIQFNSFALNQVIIIFIYSEYIQLLTIWHGNARDVFCGIQTTVGSQIENWIPANQLLFGLQWPNKEVLSFKCARYFLVYQKRVWMSVVKFISVGRKNKKVKWNNWIYIILCITKLGELNTTIGFD